MRGIKYNAVKFSERLDPCPFCGGKAEFVFWGEEEKIDEETIMVYPVIEIRCRECPASMTITDGLIQSWNKRKAKRTKK